MSQTHLRTVRCALIQGYFSMLVDRCENIY